MNRKDYPNFFSSPDFLDKSLKLFVQPNSLPKLDENVRMETLSQISLVGAMSGIEIDSQKPRFDVDNHCEYNFSLLFCLSSECVDAFIFNHKRVLASSVLYYFMMTKYLLIVVLECYKTFKSLLRCLSIF